MQLHSAQVKKNRWLRCKTHCCPHDQLVQSPPNSSLSAFAATRLNTARHVYQNVAFCGHPQAALRSSSVPYSARLFLRTIPCGLSAIKAVEAWITTLGVHKDRTPDGDTRYASCPVSQSTSSTSRMRPTTDPSESRTGPPSRSWYEEPLRRKRRGDCFSCSTTVIPSRRM